MADPSFALNHDAVPSTTTGTATTGATTALTLVTPTRPPIPSSLQGIMTCPICSLPLLNPLEATGCLACKRPCHPNCIIFSSTSINKISGICQDCQANGYQTIRPFRKCRRLFCTQRARAPSKYCTAECGVAYAENVLLKKHRRSCHHPIVGGTNGEQESDGKLKRAAIEMLQLLRVKIKALEGDMERVGSIRAGLVTTAGGGGGDLCGFPFELLPATTTLPLLPGSSSTGERCERLKKECKRHAGWLDLYVQLMEKDYFSLV